MKNVPYLIIMAIAILLIAYNVTLVDYEKPLEGNSTIALIGIFASLCTIVLLLIYITSKKIKNKIDKNQSL